VFATSVMGASPSLLEIFLAALPLGCTSFGGPVAHLGYFRQEYVERRRWLDDAALRRPRGGSASFCPGPPAARLGFGIGFLQRASRANRGLDRVHPALRRPDDRVGVRRDGAGRARRRRLAGGAQSGGGRGGGPSGMVHGRHPCAPDRSRGDAGTRRGIGCCCSCLRRGAQVGVIAAGGGLGWWLFRAGVDGGANSAPVVEGRRAGALWLAAFFAFLAGLPLLARGGRTIRGSPSSIDFSAPDPLVFGGGHVILPLLEREVVAPGWVTPHDQFLAGYGAAQALPRARFSPFAAYLGAWRKSAPAVGWADCGRSQPSSLPPVHARHQAPCRSGRPCGTGLGRRRRCVARNAAVVGVLLCGFLPARVDLRHHQPAARPRWPWRR